MFLNFLCVVFFFFFLIMSEKSQYPSLGILEEDDEFEDFPCEVWDEKMEEGDEIYLWEENWDNDEANDDFTTQLKADFQKLKEQNEMR